MKLIPHRALLIASLSLLGLGASLSAHADTLAVHATLNAASEVPPSRATATAR